jgi:RNA polymerase sigma-70 factor (ECF subfamily)
MGLEPNAIVQTLLRERLRVVAVVTAVVRDVHAADDIFQQVVLTALKAPDRFRETDHLLAWALRAARHRAVDLARCRRLRPLTDEILDLLEAQLAKTPAGDLSTRVEALHQCLDKLPVAARELLRLRYDEGLRCAAVADRLRRTVDAVYQNLSRIHRQLRECIERELRWRAAQDC